MSAAPTSQELALLYESCKDNLELGKNRVKLALRSFVDANENPSLSPNFRAEEPDPVDAFTGQLKQSFVRKDATWVLLLLKALKVLSRKQDNRLKLGEDGLTAVLLALAPPLTLKIAAEGANVILNACYESDNVGILLKTPGVQQLIFFLGEDNDDVQANAAGAIQSVCYQKEGREHVRDRDGVTALLGLLTSENPKVLARAMGALHNLSSDSDAIRTIRKADGIPDIVRLLQSPDLPIAGSAAGALQNISREVASRLVIREFDAVPHLARLLSSQDLQAQVCAAGALLNILGPELDAAPPPPSASALAMRSSGAGPSGQPGQQQQQRQRESRQTSAAASGHQRRGLGRLMSLLMASSVICECVFEQRPAVA